jgi:lipopolysaccharide/colanic/teichoic acid biosynthesis glycosyltransferase
MSGFRERLHGFLGRHGQGAQRALKRGVDVAVSGAALAALWPALVAIGVAVRLDSPGPALFVQERSGEGGETFRIYKFRTMAQGSEKGDVIVTQGDARVTKVGEFLRRTSLDEVPQLLNILKGEMSVVGPRPTLPYQVAQYDEFQRRRLEMPPGVTGWAQIHGRNSLPWPRRIELDVWYVEHWDLLLDLEILARTVPVVLFGDEEALYGSRENFTMFHQPAQEAA